MNMFSFKVGLKAFSLVLLVQEPSPSSSLLKKVQSPAESAVRGDLTSVCP